MKPNHDLHDFMRDATQRMAAEYQRIQKRVRDDPGTAGDQGEENWAALLRAWLPRSYTVVTKGRIIGHNGIVGPQVDVLVLDPSYPPALDNTKVYLAGGVAAAFECKITLTAEHVAEAGKNAVAVRSAYESRAGTPYRELHGRLLYGLLAHSHGWKSPGSRPSENVDGALNRLMAKTAHPRDMLDVVCVADVGAWTASRMTWFGPGMHPWSESMAAIYGPDGSASASYVGSTSDATNQEPSFTPVGAALAAVLRRLAWEDPSIRKIADYFRIAGLMGSGIGSMHHFTDAIYSRAVARRVRSGALVNGANWDEWELGFF